VEKMGMDMAKNIMTHKKERERKGEKRCKRIQ
jgi:hypothetical protein